MELNNTTKTGAMPPDNTYQDQQHPGNLYPSQALSGHSLPDNPPPYSSISQNDPSAPTIDTTGPPPPAPGFTNPNPAPAFVPVIIAQQMGPKTTVVVCHSCNQQITTRIIQKASMKTHLFALILCVVGCWPLACLPYCMDSCLNTDHYCTNCNAFIGSYSPN